MLIRINNFINGNLYEGQEELYNLMIFRIDDFPKY